MIKVILLTSYGEDCFPGEVDKFAVELMKKEDKLWRVNTELINRIESLPVECVEVNSLNSISSLVKVKDEDGIRYYFPNPRPRGLLKVGSLKIVEVDNSSPWCIESYDGYESIRYLDDYKEISREINFYEFRG